jgi:hypothetical protein
MIEQRVKSFPPEKSLLKKGARVGISETPSYHACAQRIGARNRNRNNAFLEHLSELRWFTPSVWRGGTLGRAGLRARLYLSKPSLGVG